MHSVKLNLQQGLVFIDSTCIAVDKKGFIDESIAKICRPPIKTDEGTELYRLSKKLSIFGNSADCMIETELEKVTSVTFLFDLIEFFESSILESTILKLCKKSSNIDFLSNHPTRAFIDHCEWGQAIFFYDPKQGDLSLNITFQRNIA